MNFDHKHVWLDGRYRHLPALINERKLRCGAEVGVARGGHALAILTECPTVYRLYGVDPYQHREGYDDPMNLPQEEFDALYEDVCDRMDPFLLNGRFELLRLASVDGALWIGQDPHIPLLLDFVYIDAEHTTIEVATDCAVWWRVLREGGILAGDDFNMPEVAEGVRYFAKRVGRTFRVEDGLFWWMER